MRKGWIEDDWRSQCFEAPVRQRIEQPRGFIAPLAEAIGAFLGASTLTGAATMLGASILLTGVMTAAQFALRAIIGKPKITSFADQAAGRQITLRQPAAPFRVVYGSVGRLAL